MAETSMSMSSDGRPSTRVTVSSIRGISAMEPSPPISPSSASGPSIMSSRHHSISNGRLFAPLSPPPTAPLPALPLGQQVGNAVPVKPKLIPKRELSRSPSPIISRTEQRQAYETKAARDELARARQLARHHKLQLQQGEQYGYALVEEDSDDGPAAAAASPPFTHRSRAASIQSIHTSPSHDSSSRQQRKAGTPSSNGLRYYEPVSPISSFNSMDGPLLLNSNVKRQGQVSSTKMRGASKQLLRSNSHDQQGSIWSSTSQSDAACKDDRTTPMSLSRSEAGTQERAKASRRLQGGLQESSDDVVMQDDAGGNSLLDMDDGDDEEEDEEDEYEPVAAVLQQRPSVGERQSSAATTMMDPEEPSWADDASVIDIDEQQYYPRIAPEEVFEVAALRRQVEQLQMALKKQMAAPVERSKDKGMLSPSRSTDRYPFGMPTPDASREGSSVSGGVAAGFKTGASPSSSRSFREQHLSPAHFSSEQTSPSMFFSDRRSSSAAARSTGSRQLFSNDYYPSDYPRKRITSEEMSSIVPEESASVAVVREEDGKLEELSRKIQALEAMFKTSTLSSRAPSIAPSTATAGSSRTQIQQYQDSLSIRSTLPRRASLVTISSTFDGNTSATERRSPAASAYNFNATDPFDFERPSLVSRNSSTSNSSMEQGATRKGVARFIMGVGTSRSNVPRDEHGNPLPSMQVSWSRKRNEKIAKPVTNAKMKVGPGRGRIVLQSKP